MAIQRDKVWTGLEQTNQRFDAALSNMSQGVCFFDGHKQLIVANRRYSELYALPPGVIGPGTRLQDIVALRCQYGSGPAMTTREYLGWRETMQQSPAANDTVVELANGRIIAIHHQPMPDSGWVSTHEDITERRRAEAQVIHMARHDALTGLPNRILFRQRLDQALASTCFNQYCAVLYIDLDRFKTVNDTCGHPAGDSLLQQVASRLRACARNGDVVTRLGGDEFAILATDLARPEIAAEIASRITSALAGPFEIEGHRIAIGASVGIAVAPDDGISADKLLKCADTALYEAKAEQRGTFRFFRPGMDAGREARTSLEHDLRQAIHDNAFTLAFQPLFDLLTDKVCAFEALLRWQHPVRGVVPPGIVIPLAEETKLIIPLGAWVLQQACAVAAQWPGDVRIAVNLSPVQFVDDNLVATVERALAAANLPPNRLELEITETVLLGNSQRTTATLRALHSLGVRIALDDFGTGYSSLSYLRGFPFDKIKIDQSFIRDLTDTPESIAIIRAVVGLSRGLGMSTTAEGVETPAQLERLRAEGCTEVQGYLLGRPGSSDDATHLLQAANA